VRMRTVHAKLPRCAAARRFVRSLQCFALPEVVPQYHLKRVACWGYRVLHTASQQQLCCMQVAPGNGCAFLANCTACSTASKCVALYETHALQASAETIMEKLTNETAVCAMISSMAAAPGQGGTRKMLNIGDVVRGFWWYWCVHLGPRLEPSSLDSGSSCMPRSHCH
jgi:hypothetical protein